MYYRTEYIHTSIGIDKHGFAMVCKLINGIILPANDS